MFNFHKPRTYRSAEGCCICKAKSSSSRFIDSRKYERDTMLCFDLKYPRQGEICNACVLLIKRFKRLPVGSQRNWSHIVDAKANIGQYNKIQTKFKSERINSKTATQQQINEAVSTLTLNSSSTCAVNKASPSSSNSLCFVPEKFSKILKKSKKLKENLLQNSSKRKSANNGWSQNNTNSLPTTPDSVDSDYEETRPQTSLSGNACTSSVVQFQTQTRASAYKAQAAAEARMKIVKLGSKRRKRLQPRKKSLSTNNEESFQFFDDEEWHERKLCCGILYECPALGGALLIDTTNFKPCEQHQQQSLIYQEKTEKFKDKTANLNKDTKKTSSLPLAKSIIQTMPAVVQLQPSQGTLSSSSLASTTHSMSNNTFNKISTSSLTTPTPVLKKHHLFFKRQSECFPQGDVVITTNSNNNIDISTYSTKNSKTEIVQHQHHHHHTQQQRQQNSLNLQKHTDNAIHSSSQANPLSTESFNTLALSVSVTPSSSSSASIPTMPQMPKHSLAKVTTISPTLTTSIQQTHYPYNTNSNNSTMPLAKPNGLLHKVKLDSGKIVKHSLEKFNTAVRLKSSDINEIKPIIRTVDKSYIIAKPPSQANIVSLNATNTATTTYQSLTSYNAAGPMPITTTSLSAASPTSSTSSTSSTKFSDNSSDSGFDENMLDRKSASPSQEDCEKKILSRPGVQTMFLAGGVQIHGQQQNLVLNGNEMAAKILQNRKYSTMATSSISATSRTLSSNHNPTTTAVKIAQISTSSLISPSPSTAAANYVGSQISMSSAAQAKMRAIYNNNNTIQHENGITTIVPASSLAATTQTAAMQNIAPSTVTITPAPPVGTQYNPQNIISRKLTSANIINLQSNTNNLSNSHNNASGNHHLCSSSSLNSSSSSGSNNNHNNMTNQKIILLKTSANNTTAVTASGNYNSLAGGGGGPLGNGGGGR